uniref:ATP-binding protein n=1 Tax=Arthrobacter rhizosphaerae TaxID=2855490 RepID=UPI001FF1484D
TDTELMSAADGVGFPLLIKPSAGGGGKGMHVVERPEELAATLATARRVAASAFGDDTLFLERLIRTPRHIEVQVLADNHGNVIHLGERECSLQRRHQKVIEEAPSPLLESLPDGAAVRERIGEAACQAARSVNYSGAGTIEFLVSAEAPDEFFFMEMNTRLQVEHPVTEMVTGVDLVEWQVRIAAGEVLTVAQADVELTGHAIEARVYAEIPERNFLPSTGTVLLLDEKPTGAAGSCVRVDSALLNGLEISSNYDPMVSKVIAWGVDRKAAIHTLNKALTDYALLGVETNVEYLRLLINDDDVCAGRLDTGLIERKIPGFTFRHVDEAELAAAAVYIWSFTKAQSGSGRDRNSAWGNTDGWRLGRRAPWRLTMKTPSGELASVQITGTWPSGPVQVCVNGGPERTASLTALADSRFRLTLDGDDSIYSMIPGSCPGEPQSTSLGRARPLEATIVRPGEMFLGNGGWGCRLEILSRELRLAYVLAAIERDEGRADPQVRAPMPGTVVSVAVSNGAIVTEGQLLLAVEAMKMEHQLLAPLAGTVHVTSRSGDLVKADEVVATIHPLDPVPVEDQPSNLPANQTKRTDPNSETEQHHA